MMNISLTDPIESNMYACEIHPGWPLHIDTECGLLAGVVPYQHRILCSACDLDWGVGAVSQHESCAILHADNTRERARPITYVIKEEVAEDVVEVIYK